jgi:hypothetical protein
VPLPPELIESQERLRQAETSLHAYVDSSEHDPNKHRVLAENLQRAIRQYEERIAAMLQNISQRR